MNLYTIDEVLLNDVLAYISKSRSDYTGAQIVSLANKLTTLQPTGVKPVAAATPPEVQQVVESLPETTPQQ